MNNFIIGISGPSGVGKTTISKLISYLFKNEEVLILSGDDLHKWERNHPNWEKYTHLNPISNNLELGILHLRDLKNGKSIFRKIYNHETGKFDTSTEIKSKPIIIYEGLHSLYNEEICKLIDLKIYVDTDENLTKEWKIKRDTLSRGYSEDKVIEIMNRRKNDEFLYIYPQKLNSDVIVKFTKNKKIDFTYSIQKKLNNNNKKLIINLKKIYKTIKNFLTISDFLSADISLVQGKGGNISIKYDDKFIIKSSGYKMSEITFTDGITICKKNNDLISFSNENEYEIFSKNLMYSYNSKPSMEVGFHNNLNHKVIIHTHPIYLNTILCSKESKEIINSIFNNLDYVYIDYITPGHKISNFFNKKYKQKIFFLENHGLIIGTNSVKEGINLTKKINIICENWLINNSNEFINDIKIFKNGHLFPDSVIFNVELREIEEYILNLIYKCGLTPKFLSHQETQEIENLKSEQYRKNKK